jgi:hypothetical protein
VSASSSSSSSPPFFIFGLKHNNKVAQVLSFVTPLHDDNGSDDNENSQGHSGKCSGKDSSKSSGGSSGVWVVGRDAVWKSLLRTPWAPLDEIHAYFGAKVVEAKG